MNVELPEVHSRRADLLGETSDGRFIHVELQSANDPEMGQRMVEYAVAIRGCSAAFRNNSYSTSAKTG